MKRIFAAISAIVLISAIGLTACSAAPKQSASPAATAAQSTAAETTAPAPTQTATASASASAEAAATTTAGKQFTLEELKKYDGQNGNPAYVAVGGTVYDVTNANGWHNGKHQSGVTAGQDLTDMISKSPHGASVLSGLPVVGTLK